MHAERRAAQGLSAWRQGLLYFALTFGISWSGALALVAPRLWRGEAIPKFTGLMMFPVMLLGPLLAGVGLTWRMDGAAGVKELGASLRRWRTGAGWYLMLLLPPCFVLAALFWMRLLAGAAYAPHLFLPGLGFGLVAGWVEEIGWTGFALERLLKTRDGLRPALVVGGLWAVWHLPVIDFLGAATPHGQWLVAYWLAFAAVLGAMRVLIAFLYANTRSVLLAQMMHASSTGALVVFSPAQATAGQECVWYAVYAALLWLSVAVLVSATGRSLRLGRVGPGDGK